MSRNEIRLVSRRPSLAVAIVFAIIVGALLALAMVAAGDLSNWGLQ